MKLRTQGSTEAATVCAGFLVDELSGRRNPMQRAGIKSFWSAWF